VRADVDAVQELTNVLVLCHACLADESSGTRGQIDVCTLQDEFVLDASVAFLDDDTRKHVHDAYDLLSEVVANLQRFAAISDVRVDGEVRINQPHSVLELMLNAVEQVTNVAADSVDRRKLLRLRKEHARLHLFAAVAYPQLEWKMLEVPLQSAMLTSDFDLLTLD